MTMRDHLFLFLLLPLIVMSCSQPPSFETPLVYERADPWIYLHTDGRYYFTATVPEYDRLIIRGSETIEGLSTADEKVIWEKYDTGIMGSHIWAPELHYLNGKWYIYFAAGGAEDVWAIRMYVLENSSQNPLEGEWIEKGQITTNWETFSLDATVFEHGDKDYLVWAQHPPEMEGNTALYIAELENPWTIKEPMVEISRPDYDWEKQLYKVNEGATVLKRNGKIFISYSASGTDHNYVMGLLVADDTADMLDPDAWDKSPVPVFKSSEENGIYGPGHNSFTTTKDGKYDLLVFHARSYKEIDGNPLRDPNRHMRVQVLSWDERGYPIFGVPVADTRTQEE